MVEGKVTEQVVTAACLALVGCRIATGTATDTAVDSFGTVGGRSMSPGAAVFSVAYRNTAMV